MSRRKDPRALGAMRRRLATQLAEVDALMQRKHWVDARDKLVELDRRYPDRDEVLTPLANAYLELKDTRGYQEVCERLLKIRPNDPDVTLGLAGAYMTNVRPALALQTFRRFLQRCRDHPRAAEARQTVADLEAGIDEMLASAGLTGEDRLELSALHERILSLLDQRKFVQARQTAQELLRRRPNFIPALNNLSQIHSAEGEIDEAIATAQRVLALDPDNFHALANLARNFCITGRMDDARAYAERLKAVESPNTDVWARKMETLSYLGDDQGVLDVFAQAERAGALDLPLADPLLYHLAAVAELRLGHAEQARQHWQHALKLAPGFDLARENWNDLHAPVGKRHAPWAFRIGNWMPEAAVRDLAEMLDLAVKRGEQAITQVARRYLQQHPEMLTLVPLLLERGDPQGREFALRLARMAETPEMLAALRDFALSARGPDDMRHEAAQVASRAGLLSSPVRMWMKGEWLELLLFDIELHDEPTVQHKPQVEQWLADAVIALHEDKWDKGERLLRQALEVEPDAPDILNNLAVVYENRGRTKEAESIVRQIIEQHPNYVFARASLARVHLRRGEIDRAAELLKPLLALKRFNFQEYAAFCAAQIELLLAQDKPDGARSWLSMWEGFDPENPALADYRRRVNTPQGGKKFLGRTLKFGGT